MYPITDDPLAWQGSIKKQPFWIPDGGLLYVWTEYEIWVANDDRYDARQDESQTE